MGKAGRAELIRAIFKAKAGGFAYAASGKPPKAKEPVRLRRGVTDSFDLALSFRWGRREWLEAPDAKPMPVPEPDRRRKGETALTRISRQLPAKLPRVLF